MPRVAEPGCPLGPRPGRRPTARLGAPEAAPGPGRRPTARLGAPEAAPGPGRPHGPTDAYQQPQSPNRGSRRSRRALEPSRTSSPMKLSIS
jgi:hypothetical protein